jgi:hypothetical protein
MNQFEPLPSAGRALGLNLSEITVCCPVCGTDAGMHFGAPQVVAGTPGEPERDGKLVVPLQCERGRHETHLVFSFHGGIVSLFAQKGRFLPAFGPESQAQSHG